MKLLLSPAQKAHLAQGEKLFFSPEAIKLRDSDPIFKEIAQVGALEHYLKGWKYLAPRYGKKDVVIKDSEGNIVREGKNELPGLALEVDDPVDIDELEVVRHQIAETKRFMEEGEVPDSFSSLSQDKLDFLKEASLQHLDGGTIDKIGELGTKNRKYATTDPIVERRGQKIPAVFEPGQKRERGIQLIMNAFQNIDVDTGVGTYGVSKDALHRQSAANQPRLLTDKSNIRIGPSSLNQSVKEFEGDKRENALKTRLLRLNNEEFFLENGVRAAPPDALFGAQTKQDLRIHNAREKELNQLLEGIRNMDKTFD